MTIDAIDQKIISWLQQQGRITNAELAEKINLSASACLRRVRRLEEDGIIDGYAALINQAAIGKSATIFVEISLQGQSEEHLAAFERGVTDCRDVTECYLMSGDADYLLKINAAGAEDYERIHKTQLSRLPGVARMRSNFALRTVMKRQVSGF